jgi:hypothetical protein
MAALHVSPAPFPVLLNAWKHHAGWVRERIADVATGGETAIPELAAELLVTGGRIMDVYFGPLTVCEIGHRVLDGLRMGGRFEPGVYARWLEGQGGYAVVPVGDDGSRWAIRLGPLDGRYVHIHPGRYSPNTVRVHANPWKTAILVHALAPITGRFPADLAVVNEVRTRWLDLPAVSGVGAAVGEAIGLLSGQRDGSGPHSGSRS